MNWIFRAIPILALLPWLQAEPTKFTQEEKVALVQYARSLLLDHFDAESVPVPKEVLRRLQKHKHKVFVLVRNQGKSRGCFSGGGDSLPVRLSSAMRNTLKDDRYGGGLKKEELAYARLELFILQPEMKLEKDLDVIDSIIKLGVDSIRFRGKVNKKIRHATFLNYVPITSGYSIGRMLDRLAKKADIRLLALPYLQEVLRRSKKAETQAYVALTEIGSREKHELPAALGLFKSTEKSKRDLGGRALLLLIDDAIKNKRSSMTKALLKTALPVLKAGLKNSEESTRLEAVTGLKLLGSRAREAMPDLAAVTQKDSSTEVRSEAAKALMKMIVGNKDKKPEGIPSSKDLLKIASRHSADRKLRSLPSLRSGVIARAVLAHPDSSIYLVPTVHLLETSAPEKVIELYRCNTLVLPQDVNEKSVTESIRLGGEWLLTGQRWDGSLEYQWYVNGARYSRSKNNMIRQWMSTLCLNELGRFFVDDKYHHASRRNLAFNIQHYYREAPEFGLGFIYFRKKCKLGSAAFAVRSLLHIDRKKEYEHHIQALRKFLFYMFQDDGSFRTIYYPNREVKFSEKDDYLQRYYSGEGLVALMELFTRRGDREAYEVVQKAFKYQRDYFNEDGHPASIPWLAQAYARAHSVKANKDYAEFVFKMSDFILSIQNKKKSPPDHYGRFSSPKWRKTYGPPFAASTGVYLEGLVAAYKLAKSLNDKNRAERYRIGIILACRALMQLQFRDDNLFFVKDALRTRGGVRGNVMSTIIRMDNTQHAIQGMMRAVQALDSWELPKKYWLELGIRN